jgi:MFS family permease
LSSGFFYLLLTQFITSTADNALLLVGIAMLMEQSSEPWWIPILKAIFTLSFIVFAPFVGIWSDLRPKRLVMQFASILKIISCLGLLLFAPLTLCMALAGFAAALYSPAKYGLVTEIVPVDDLVKANAWLEVSTILASIFGIILGGFLVNSDVQNSMLALWLNEKIPIANGHISVLALFMAYLVSSMLTLKIPYTHAALEVQHNDLWLTLSKFVTSCIRLWQDPEGRVSLSVTTLFWGCGATLQLLILAWSQEHLSLTLSQATYIQASGALGMIAGAFLASKLIRIEDARKLLRLGLLMGLLIAGLDFSNSWISTIFLMVAVGILTGLFLVPMNALLQHRGKVMLSTGESIAVQNFCENTSIVLLTSLYSACIGFNVSNSTLLILFGIFISGLMALIIKLNTSSSRFLADASQRER